MKILIFFTIIGFASAKIQTFTQAEVDVVYDAWNAVKNSEVDILAAVFRAYPDIQARFPAFAGKDLDSIKGSAAFATHATRIVQFFTSVITLGKAGPSTYPAGFTLMNELARNHINRGITKELFTEFRAALKDYVMTHAPWNDNVDTLWEKGMDNMYFVIFSNYDGKPVNSID